MQINIVGCGYIGKLIAKELIQNNYEIQAFVKSDISLNQCQQLDIPCQFLDLDHADTSFHNTFSNSSLIYLVPPQTIGQEDNRTKRFLTLIQKDLPQHFVLISTSGVYGQCNGEWVTENTPTIPLTDRAKRRLDSENQVITFCNTYNISYVILRVPGIYGPGKLPVQRIKSGTPILKSEDSGYSNRIHSYDLTQIFIEALLSKKITGIYNCSDGNPTTMNDFFIKTAGHLNLNRPPQIDYKEAERVLSKEMLSYLNESKRLSNKKLHNEFKYKIKFTDLDNGLNNC